MAVAGGADAATFCADVIATFKMSGMPKRFIGAMGGGAFCCGERPTIGEHAARAFSDAAPVAGAPQHMQRWSFSEHPGQSENSV